MKILAYSVFAIILAFACCNIVLAKGFHSLPELNGYERELWINAKHDNKGLIFYNGYNGFNWAIVLEDIDSLLVISGHTSDGVRADTMIATPDILKWGIDTLASEAQRRKPYYNEEYWPNYKQMFVLSEFGDTLFSLNNAMRYSGPDSISFNSKLNKLIYTLYWFSCPAELRSLIPLPNMGELGNE